jgi:hypothetical protein
MNLIQAIGPKVYFKDVDDEEPTLNLYNLTEAVDEWPKVKDDDGEEEDLDLENVEIIKLDPDEVIVWCGGDWQSPMTVTIHMVNNRPTVVSAVDGGHYNDHTFLSEDEACEIFRKC